MRSSCLNSIIAVSFGCVIIAEKNKTNRIHERCLIYNDKKSSFENFLDKDKSISINHINLNMSRAIEIYKVHRGISPKHFK